jgi:ribosome-binding factor A
MKRASRRSGQVAETIRQIVAESLTREVRDPRVQRVTVTAVRVSPDLAHAEVRVVVGEGEDQDRTLEGLQSAAGFLRTKVARALATRVVPELVFAIDRGVEHARNIDRLLATLRPEGGDET